MRGGPDNSVGPPFAYQFISRAWLEELGEGEGGHGVDDGDGAGEDTGVVAAAGVEGCWGVLVGDGGYILEEGGDGFEAYAEGDGHAVGDAALDAAGVVGLAGGASVGARDEFVDHLGAAAQAAVKAHAEFYGFGRRNGHHRVG